MTLWDYATRVYARPGVRDACLALQDDHGQSVSLLLWRAWTLTEGRRITSADEAAIVDLARPWEASVIAPLRAARRALRSPPPEPRGGDLHDQVGKVELAAERALLEALERLTPTRSAGETDWPGALKVLAAAWRPGTPATSLSALVAALQAA